MQSTQVFCPSVRTGGEMLGFNFCETSTELCNFSGLRPGQEAKVQ